MALDVAATPEAIAELSALEVRRSALGRWGLRFGVVIGWGVFSGAWYVSSYFLLEPRLLPPPHQVLEEAWQVLSAVGFMSTFWASLARVMAGCLMALAVSTVLGLAAAYSNWWRGFIHSATGLLLHIPDVTLAVLTLIVFGVSGFGPVLTATLVATPYVMSSVTRGIVNVDRKLIVMSESFARTRAQIILGVLLPSSVLTVIGSSREAFALAWRITLLTEIFASSNGVGFEIRRSFEGYDVHGMLAWTLLFVSVMFLFEGLVLKRLERRAYGGTLAESADRGRP